MGLDPLDEPAPGSSVAPARPKLEGFEPHNKVRLSDANRERIMTALLDGYPKVAIAKALSISAKTLDRLIHDDDELLDQVEAQRAFEETELRDILMELARKGDTVAAIFLAKARHGWRDRDDAKLNVDTGGGGVLVVPGTMPIEQWNAAAALQQAKYRERIPDAPLDERDMRTRASLMEGMGMKRVLPSDLTG